MPHLVKCETEDGSTLTVDVSSDGEQIMLTATTDGGGTAARIYIGWERALMLASYLNGAAEGIMRHNHPQT